MRMEEQHHGRISAIDLTRGLAIGLMILSHGVKGLLSFDQFPSWGIVPVHLVTKFSSTAFFLTFGFSLAVSFAPATRDPERWRKKRRRLFLRGLEIFLWYKLLTMVEMSHLHSLDQVAGALFYQEFPSYCEILGFYALSLLWIPLVLPFWERCSLRIKTLFPVGFILLSVGLTELGFLAGIPQLKALLVEDEAFYTWGQISRAPFVFLGLFLGELYRRNFLTPGLILNGSILLGGVFLITYWPDLNGVFWSLAVNEGKHPPELSFVLFSLSGALLLLGASFRLGDNLKTLTMPFRLIGRDPLAAFNVHLLLLFLLYRHGLGLWLKVSYLEALSLTGGLFIASVVWIKLKLWSKQHEQSETFDRTDPPPWRDHRHRPPYYARAIATAREEAGPGFEEIPVAEEAPGRPYHSPPKSWGEGRSLH